MMTKELGFIMAAMLLLTHTADFVRSANIRRSQAEGSMENHKIGCMEMRSEEGLYTFISEGTDTVCGFYVIANPTQRIQVQFVEFNIDCNPSGILATVDGWEIQRQFFPSELDHPLPMSQRYQTYCGQKKPFTPVITNQNVFLIQALVPTGGQGYVVRVHFLDNPTPCNAVSLLDTGTVTLSNYGQRSNCSVSILYPQVMEVVGVDVGVTPLIPQQITELGALLKRNVQQSMALLCDKRGRQDYVELLDGNGLDPYYMFREVDFCGLDTDPVNMRWLLGCQHSVVRLVSSGRFLNSVTIRHRPLTQLESKRAALLSC